MDRFSIRLKFGKRVKQWRIKRGLTQVDLATKADIKYKHLQRIEGNQPPAVRIDMIAAIASALRVKPSTLIE